MWWYGLRREAVAKGLDNRAAPHVYRLSVREDGVVQIYRDAKLLAVRNPTRQRDALTRTDGAYLQWGEGAGGSEADALVQHVAFDLTGAHEPARPPARTGN